MSHLLHGCRSNHDGHWNIETQYSCSQVYLTYIYKNTRPKPIPSEINSKSTTWVKSFNGKVQWNLAQNTKKKKTTFWDDYQLAREELTKSWKMHVGSPWESTDPLHQMHSSHRPSLAISALQLPHTQKHWLSPSLQLYA